MSVPTQKDTAAPAPSHCYDWYVIEHVHTPERRTDHKLPLEEALKPATINVAKALNFYPRKGCLKPDSDADLLVLDADMKLEAMYAKGKQMMANGAPIVKGYFEK